MIGRATTMRNRLRRWAFGGLLVGIAAVGGDLPATAQDAPGPPREPSDSIGRPRTGEVGTDDGVLPPTGEASGASRPEPPDASSTRRRVDPSGRPARAPALRAPEHPGARVLSPGDLPPSPNAETLFDVPPQDGAVAPPAPDDEAPPARPLTRDEVIRWLLRELGREDSAGPELPENLPERLEAELPRMGAIELLPPTPIPDDPPPHEGALIDLPVTAEPPDILLVEVLEALAGRPITGEALVRPDGTISLGFYGAIHVRGLTVPQIKTKVVLHLRQFLSDETLGLVGLDQYGDDILIMPADSDRVFVDFAAYNSKVYYVQGDVAAPGRLPWTGKDTVLDAINWAGGIHPTGDPTAITLYRPARGEQPARRYAIDLDAIQRGDAEENLQLFPGDRLYVERDATVKETLKVDRVAAPLNTIFQELRHASAAAQSLNTALKDSGLSAAERSALIRDFVDFWWDQATRPEDEPMDEEAFKAEVRRFLDAAVPREPE
jgi:polysaccharide export outer membrane protein